MTIKAVQKGDTFDWVNATGSTKASGAVVVAKHTIGVAVTDILNGDTGAVAIEGVFIVPKVSGAVFVQGEKLIWINGSLSFDDSLATPATGDITGAAVAMVAGANGETTAVVKLTPGNATLT